MNNAFMRPTLAAAAVGAVFLAFGGQASASGFQLQEQSASGLGVAYSGMAAAVQDASTAFWNPAGMTYLSGKNVAGAIHYIAPNTKFNNSGSTFGALGDGGQAGESAFVPALYATWQLDPRWTVGLVVNAPFGLATKWDTPWAGQFHGIKSEVETLNINPTVAYKVNDMFSLGGGVSYQRVKATLTSAVNAAGNEGIVQGEDWAWGWNLGAMIDFRQGTRIGLTYRSSVKYTLDGDFTTPPALAAAQSDVQAEIKLPETFSIGLSHQFNQKLRVLADYTYTGWDSIQTLDIVRTSGPLTGRNVSSTPLNFKNTWRMGVGAEYQLNQPWLLRAGLAFDKAPVQDDFRTPRLPDEDRTWLSIGARYTHSAALSFDFGYTYIWVDDAASQLAGGPGAPGSLFGSYKTSIQILAAQANFRF
jgi:long-chain fatty acid transport protein